MTRIVAAAFALAALSGAAQAAESLSLGYALSADSHYGKGAQVFAETLERLSNGAFEVLQAPAGQLGGERDMIHGLQLGALDLVITSTGPLSEVAREIYVLDLPFLFRDYAHARAVLDGPVGDELLSRIDAHHLVGLAWAENGFRHFTTSSHAISTPADLAGLKLRTMENNLHIATFKAMGAAPTPMAFPEVFSALQTGLVDGQENPIAVINAEQLWKVQKFASLTGHVYSAALVMASPALMDRLGAEQRGWLTEAARASAAAIRDEVLRQEEVGLQAMRAHGMEVVTEIDKAPFQAQAERVRAAYEAEFGAEMLKRIEAVK